MSSKSKRIFLAALLVISCAFAYGLFGPRVSALNLIRVVMNPDSSAFAYALDIRRYPGSGPTAWTRSSSGQPNIEIWSYDLVNRTGPRRIARWSHDDDKVLQLLAWTKDGLYVADVGNPDPRCELIDPTTGRRDLIGEIPWDDFRRDRPGGASPDDNRNTSLRARQVVQRHREFFLWDPIARRKQLLFALPLEQDGLPDYQREDLLRLREMDAQRDAVHGIWQMTASPLPTGMTFHIDTFAKRPGTLTRRYVIDLDLAAPNPTRETEGVDSDTLQLLIDTTLAIGPQGGVTDLFVPYTRIREVLQPFRGSTRMRGATLRAHVTSDLRPAGTTRESPTRGSVFIEVPLR